MIVFRKMKEDVRMHAHAQAQTRTHARTHARTHIHTHTHTHLECPMQTSARVIISLDFRAKNSRASGTGESKRSVCSCRGGEGGG